MNEQSTLAKLTLLIMELENSERTLFQMRLAGQEGQIFNQLHNSARLYQLIENLARQGKEAVTNGGYIEGYSPPQSSGQTRSGG